MSVLKCYLFLKLILISLATLAASSTSTTSATKPTSTTTAPAPPPTTAPKTSTTEPTTTTTTTTTQPTTTTTEPPVVLDSNCTSKDDNWCNSSIAGSAICNSTDICMCDIGYIRKDTRTCLPETVLKPDIQSFTNISDTSLTVTWQMNVSLNWTFNVTCTGNQSGTTKTQFPSSPKATFSNLTSGDEYNVTVTASFIDDLSVVHTGMSTERQAIDPAIPGEVSQSNYTAPNITLMWGSSVGIVAYYTVTSQSISQNISQISTNSTVELYNLKAGKTYNVAITAMSNGRSSQTRNDSFYTDVTAPDPPGNLRNTSVNETSVKLEWDPTPNPNGNLTGYLVCYEGKVYEDLTDFSLRNCTSVRNVLQHEVDSLVEGAFYNFNVYSVNTEYNSTVPARLTNVRTLESVPGEVTGLAVQVINLIFIVTWGRPAAPNGDIIQYRIDWTSDDVSCTDYLNTDMVTTPTTPTSSPDCLEISNASNASIGVNQKNMTSTISGLTPYTNYTITVTPYTSIGSGTSLNTTKRTSVVKPDPVTNVTATVINATVVSVSWTIPARYPGPVNYTVTAVDMIRGQEQDTGGCNVQDYESSSCVVGDLEEYWKYWFAVVASTDAGNSNESRSEITTTAEGKPGKIKNFSISLFTAEHCNATRVNISWYEPDLLDRNANITKYIINDTTTNGPGKEFPVDKPDPYRNTSVQFSAEISGLAAERKYHKKIQAQTEMNHLGEEYYFNFTTQSCAPPDWPSTASVNENSAKQTSSSFTITLDTGFFMNMEQGQIMETGLIISKNNQTIEVISAKAKTWSASQAKSFSEPYAIEVEASGSSLEITIGEDKCDASHEQTVRCNGQLPSNQKFYVMAYACTKEDKCKGSPFFGAFATAAITTEPPKSNKVAVAVGVSITVAVVLVIAILVVIMQRRGTIDILKICRGAGGKEPDDFGPPVMTQSPVRLSEFDSHLMELHNDSNLLFSCQYEDIGKLSKQIYKGCTTEAANLEDNKAKNRWVDILPFDYSRVKLQQLDDDDPASDYINANFIPGHTNQRAYIATQGPLPGTIDDFWRMIWEHNVAIIVNLTQCKEGNRVKCENYWPNEIHEPKQYGEVVVDPVSISTMNKYNITIFHVSVNDTKRTVYHFHYLEFPDMSASVEYDIFMEFMQAVRSHIPRDVESPIVVHCSAGVGRTGTFIALDRLSQFLNKADFHWDMKVDIFDMVVGMRNSRTNMVQTESQYVMIHDCFNEMLEIKKRASEEEVPDENLYVNQAYEHDNVNQLSITHDKLSALWCDFKACEECGNERIHIQKCFMRMLKETK